MTGKARTTKYAKGAKREAKLLSVENHFMEKLPDAGHLRLRERGRSQPAVTESIAILTPHI
jgi:hypothetical protein